jgi:hypothetical protein
MAEEVLVGVSMTCKRKRGRSLPCLLCSRMLGGLFRPYVSLSYVSVREGRKHQLSNTKIVNNSFMASIPLSLSLSNSLSLSIHSLSLYPTLSLSLTLSLSIQLPLSIRLSLSSLCIHPTHPCSLSLPNIFIYLRLS